jgi:hypothetical protein
MKTLSAIILFFTILACKKQDTAPQESALAGKWEWLESQGGKTGMTVKASQVNNRQLVFTHNGDFEMIENGESKIKTNYVIREGSSITSAEKVPLIYYRSNYWQQSYQVRRDSLFLTDEVYDGYRHIYLKIR